MVVLVAVLKIVVWEDFAKRPHACMAVSIPLSKHLEDYININNGIKIAWN